MSCEVAPLAPLELSPADSYTTPMSKLEDDNRFSAWRHGVSHQSQFEHMLHPLPDTFHETRLQEPLSRDALCPPSFWETRGDNDLTMALITAQRCERWAEGQLFRQRLKRISIEQAFYTRMQERTTQEVRDADIRVGIAHATVRASNQMPAWKTSDDVEDNVDGNVEGSDVELSSVSYRWNTESSASHKS